MPTHLPTRHVSALPMAATEDTATRARTGEREARRGSSGKGSRNRREDGENESSIFDGEKKNDGPATTGRNERGPREGRRPGSTAATRNKVLTPFRRRPFRSSLS